MNSEPFVWSHRGRNRIAPENTLPAFAAAVEAGDHGIELDITMSADGIAYVIHDDLLERTTDGSGEVRDLPSHRLDRFDAGSWFDPAFRGTRIPRLSDVLDLLSSSTLEINIEIKASARTSGDDTSVEAIALEEVRRFGMEERVLVSSFEWRILEAMHFLAPGIRLGVLAEPGADPRAVASAAISVDAFSIHPAVTDLISGVPDYTLAGTAVRRRIYPYTVRDADTAEAVIGAGADGYFADLPFSK